MLAGMAEGRTRKTGQHDQQLIRALAEASDAKKAVAELTKRVEHLEDELALLRGQMTPLQSTPPPRGGVTEKRVAPPPLPPSPKQKTGGSPAFIDISEMAELVESADSIAPQRPTRRGK